METEAFLLVWLLLCIGLSQLSAQSSNAETDHTCMVKYINVPGWINVTCDGVNFQKITGAGNATVIVNYWNDQPKWVKCITCDFQGTSSSGEAFHGRELDKSVAILNFDPESGSWGSEQIWSGIMTGDRGTQIKYKVSVTLSADGSLTWTWIEGRCN
jgi:hypothetical protein